MEFRVKSAVVTVKVPTREALMGLVAQKFAQNTGFALATLNLDHLVKLAGSPAFQQAYAAQDLVVADGNPIVWLSRLAGRRVDLVPGADLVLPLADLASRSGVTVALVGSTEAALARAASHLTGRVHELRVVCTVAPPFDFDPEGEEAAEILRRIDASGAGLCFVALGAPRQEMFAAMGRVATPQIGFASIGAGLDFLAGEQRRAPVWVRRLALEWVWRTATSPGRMLPRYARCLAILPGQVFGALRQRMGSGRGASYR